MTVSSIDFVKNELAQVILESIVHDVTSVFRLVTLDLVKHSFREVRNEFLSLHLSWNVILREIMNMILEINTKEIKKITTGKWCSKLENSKKVYFLPRVNSEKKISRRTKFEFFFT